MKIQRGVYKQRVVEGETPHLESGRSLLLVICFVDFDFHRPFTTLMLLLLCIFNNFPISFPVQCCPQKKLDLSSTKPFGKSSPTASLLGSVALRAKRLGYKACQSEAIAWLDPLKTGNVLRVIYSVLHIFAWGLYMNAQVRSHSAKEMIAPCPPHRIYNVRGCRVVTLIFFLMFITVFFLVSFADVSISRLFYLSPSQSSRSELHGIMFDAGSTGSRIHVYTFVKTAGKMLVKPNRNLPFRLC